MKIERLYNTVKPFLNCDLTDVVSKQLITTRDPTDIPTYHLADQSKWRVRFRSTILVAGVAVNVNAIVLSIEKDRSYLH